MTSFYEVNDFVSSQYDFADVVNDYVTCSK